MHFRPVAIILIGLTVALLGITTSASATAAKTEGCEAFAAPLNPAVRELTIVSIDCDPLNSRQERLSAPTTYRIATFWEHADWAGRYANVNTDATCDHTGWVIKNLDGIQSTVGGVSSYEIAGRCDRSEMFTGYDRTGSYSNTLYGSQPWVGSTFNDGNFRSFATWWG